jgi:hypothetical protein
MSKVYYFLTMTIGLTILMKLAGVPYGGEGLLNYFGLNTNNIFPKTAEFYILVVGVFIIAAAIGAVFSNKEAALRAGMGTGIMGVGIGAFVGILTFIKGIASGTDTWIFNVVLLIFAVYIVGFVWSMISWWSGVDD